MNKTTYNARKSKGLCVACGLIPSRNSLTMCTSCADNQNNTARKNYDPDKERKRRVMKDPEAVKSSKAKYRSKNRDILALQTRERYAYNSELWYDYGLRRLRGITIEEYKTKLNLQGGICAICGGVNKNGSRLCLDHDHKTNLNRGILCRKCNTLLGLCNDDISILENMIGYLREYN
jgi:hypothetical protein